MYNKYINTVMRGLLLICISWSVYFLLYISATSSMRTAEVLITFELHELIFKKDQFSFCVSNFLKIVM